MTTGIIDTLLRPLPSTSEPKPLATPGTVAPTKRGIRFGPNLLNPSEGGTLTGMDTLAEVEAALPKFTAEELAELERRVRNVRLTKSKAGGRSALDLPPLDLGRLLMPLGSREEWYDEMLEDRV